MATLASLLGQEIQLPDFEIGDSNLQPVETEEYNSIIKQKIESGEQIGVPEPRRNQRPIDPNTGFPVGMTEKQIEDKMIKDQQRKEFEEMHEHDRRKIEEMKQKEEQEREEKKKELEKKAQIERLEEQKKENAEVARQNLPPEPEAENESAIQISFRMPTGGTVERRFLKTDKIQLLYDYITSLGHDDHFENSHTNFHIQETFPKKILDNYSKTLQDEGLTRRCKLIIREHSHAD